MNVTIRRHIAFFRCGKIIVFAVAILAATKITLAFPAVTSASTAAFSFLIIVLLSAYFGDLPVAIATSFVATLSFDYFYLPPAGTFHIAALPDWISLATFLLASVIISRLTALAAENGAHARLLNTTLAQFKVFGDRLVSLPPDQLTLSGIAKEALQAFSLEYCSIHVYGEGKWRHFMGAAQSDVSSEIESRLKCFQDHSSDVMDLADESLMGVRYTLIKKGITPFAVVAIRSETLPTEGFEALGTMIGVQLNKILNS